MRPPLLLLYIALFVLSGCRAIFGGGGSSSSSGASLAPCEAMWEVRARRGHRIHVETNPPLAFSEFELTSTAEWVTGNTSPCGLEMAERLTDLCVLCNAEPEECERRIIATFDAAPAACAVCGDGHCFETEDENSCPMDCRENCGDGFCSDGENPLGCPVDCGTGCGDGLCNAPEDQASCPIDCSFTAGDGFCGPGEDAINSPIDCGRQTCGDAYCQSYETPLRCPEDCCLPRGCEPGVQSCGSNGEIVECIASGDADCSEWSPVETCDYGCLRTADGPRCRTCADIAEAMFGNAGWLCDIETHVPVCAGNARRRCEPIPGIVGCGHLVDEPCMCHLGECVENCNANSCGDRVHSCNEDGDLLGCRYAAELGCEYQFVASDCPANADCTEFENGTASCCPADACLTDGIGRCMDGNRSERCVVPEGRYCGTWELVETCDEGSGCTVGGAAGSSLCEACCEVGASRCYHTIFDYDVMMECVEGLGQPGCGEWADRGVCEGVSRCDDSSGTPQCVPR